MASPEADLLGYAPPLSLWRLVEQHVAAHERDEIKSMLGESVVDETLELHDELNTLLEIWRDCRQSSDPSTYHITQTRLPEPPGMRDRLLQEILFFVENVKEKSQDSTGDQTYFLKNYNKKVIDYAVNSESRAASCEPYSRPVSVIGRDGRETPIIRHSSPASDRLSSSTYSTISEDVEGMADKLNVLKLDEVVQHLRSHLAEEREFLIQDLKFLQQCIEEENEVTPESLELEPEPSIAELREERLKLEKDMLADVFTLQKPLAVPLSSNHILKPASAKQRQAIVPKTGPLRGVHTSAPDGIVLTGNVPDSVVVKAQQRLINEAREYRKKENDSSSPKIIKVGSLSASKLKERVTDKGAGEPITSVGQPDSIKRPSSALRFRSMVMNSRTVGEET